MQHLIPPHGGRLVDLMVDPEEAAQWKQQARDLPSWNLTPRQVCDLELLMNGGFSPLTGFMTRADYDRVCSEMRLADGTVWPIPIVLDVDDETAGQLSRGVRLALRDPEGVMLAVLEVSDVWQPDRREEAEKVYGTANPEHPGVEYLLHRTTAPARTYGG